MMFFIINIKEQTTLSTFTTVKNESFVTIDYFRKLPVENLLLN